MFTAENVLGSIIDMINIFLKGVIMFFVVIMFHFWGYQDGKGAFNPWLCMLIFVSGFVVYGLQIIIKKYNLKNKIQISMLVLAGILINWGISRLIIPGQRAFLLVSMLPYLEWIVTKYKFAEVKDYVQTMRNRNSNRVKYYYIIMSLIAIITIVESNYPSKEYPVSVDHCMTYCYVMTVIYFALMIVLKYVQMQYDEARKYNGRNIAFLKRQLKVDLIVFTFATVIFIPVVFIVQETIFVPLSMLIVRICLGLFGSGLSIISQAVLEKIVGLFNMTDSTAQSSVAGVQKMSITAMPDFGIVFMVVGLLVLGAVLAVILMKLYKLKGVSYKFEDEEAKFVTDEEIFSYKYKTNTARPEKSLFSHSNSDVIRKYYYKYMNSHIKTSQVKDAMCNTPSELADNYIKLKDDENIIEFTKCYEKTRYSSESASNDDVKKMKKVYRNLVK